MSAAERVEAIRILTLLYQAVAKDENYEAATKVLEKIQKLMEGL